MRAAGEVSPEGAAPGGGAQTHSINATGTPRQPPQTSPYALHRRDRVFCIVGHVTGVRQRQGPRHRRPEREHRCKPGPAASQPCPCLRLQHSSILSTVSNIYSLKNNELIIFRMSGGAMLAACRGLATSLVEILAHAKVTRTNIRRAGRLSDSQRQLQRSPPLFQCHYCGHKLHSLSHCRQAQAGYCTR